MKNIVLILTSVSLNAGAQILMRKAMMQIGEINIEAKNFISYLPQLLGNIFLWISFLCYGFSILIWIIILSKVEVSYAYAFSSLGYILVTIMGALLLHEHVSMVRIVGIIIVCFGIILVARS
ncbi:transporter [Spirochaetia bacterium]|nr:transporter [Spirochaetia bacterium]